MRNFHRIAISASVAVLTLGLIAACSPLGAINALTPGSTYERITAAYGSDARQQLDVYTPHPSIGPAPVVVFFYGGTWNTGKRQDYTFVGEALASRGIVAVIADYRLYPQVRYPAFLQDGAMAVAWTLKHVAAYQGDPKRLFVMGHSSGAYNAAMIALDGRWLKAVDLSPSIFNGWIGMAGPYDFYPIENPQAKPVFFHPDYPPDSQPIDLVTKSAPRTLLMASRDDKLVNPVRNTGGLANRLRAAGVPVTEIYYDRTGHASLIGSLSWPLRSLAPALDQIDRFVNGSAAVNNE